MTTIKLDKDTYFKCGLEYAKQGSFVEALRFFAKCDSYEAWFNRIQLFALRGDFGIANFLIREWLAKFGKHYNCLYELRNNLGELNIDNFQDIKYCRAKISKQSSKICGNADLMFNMYELLDDDEYDPITIALEELDSESERDTVMYDLNSIEYQNNLKLRSLLLHTQGKIAEGEKVTKRLLAIDSQHLSVQIWQVFMHCLNEDYQQACAIAEQIYDKDIEPNNLIYVINAMVECNCDKHKVEYCLQRLINNIQQVSYESIDQSLYVANNYLGSVDLAVKLADYVVASNHYFAIDTLRSCVQVYINNCDKDCAMNCCNKILLICPEDNWTNTVLNLLPQLNWQVRAKFAYTLPPITSRMQALPSIVERYIVRFLIDNKQNINDEYVMYAIALLAHCSVIKRGIDTTQELFCIAEDIFCLCDINSSNSAYYLVILRYALLHPIAPMDFLLPLLHKCLLADLRFITQVDIGKSCYLMDSKLLSDAKDNAMLCQSLSIVALYKKLTATSTKRLSQLILDQISTNHHDNSYQLVLQIIDQLNLSAGQYKICKQQLGELVGK